MPQQGLSGVSYSQLMGALKVKNIDVNRKTLADLAYNNIEAFTRIRKSVNEIKK